MYFKNIITISMALFLILNTSKLMSNDLYGIVTSFDFDLSKIKDSYNADNFSFQVNSDMLDRHQVNAVMSVFFDEDEMSASPISQAVLTFICNSIKHSSVTHVEVLAHSKLDSDLLGMGFVRSNNVINSVNSFLKENNCLNEDVVFEKRAMGSRISLINMFKNNADQLMVSDRIEFNISFDTQNLLLIGDNTFEAEQVDDDALKEVDKTTRLIKTDSSMVEVSSIDELSFNEYQVSKIESQAQYGVMQNNEINSLLPRGHNIVNSYSFKIIKDLSYKWNTLEHDLGLPHLHQTQGFIAHRYALQLSRIPVSSFQEYVSTYISHGLSRDKLMYKLSENGDYVYIYYNFFNFLREVNEYVSSMPPRLSRDKPFAVQLDRMVDN